MGRFGEKNHSHHHIYQHKQSNGYMVIFDRKGFKHYSYHTDFDEALKVRDEIVLYLHDLVKSQSRAINMECRIRSRENTEKTPDEE